MEILIILVLAAYILFAGILFWPIVRRPLIAWYNNSFMLVSGSNPVDILLKQVAFRLGFEAFIFGLACLFGSLGGWIYVIRRAKAEGEAEAEKNEPQN